MSSLFDDPNTPAHPTSPQADPFPELNQVEAPPISTPPTLPQAFPVVSHGTSAPLQIALEQAGRAARWTFSAVLLLLIAHAVFVAPALELNERQQRLAGERQQLEDLKPRLGAMIEPIGELRQRSNEGLREDLEAFLAGLEDDLTRLDLAVDEIRAAAVVDDTETPSQASASEEEPADIASAWEISDAELSFDLARAETPEALRDLLVPLVENEILRPRLGRLNHAWNTKVLPFLEARVDGLASDVPRMRGSLPEADEDWAVFANALSEVRRQAREFEIQPPSGVESWSQIDPEGNLILQPSDAARQMFLNPLALDELGTAFGRLSERHGTISTYLDTSLAALQGSGASLARGLRGITPGWPALAALFPALLGFLLAAFSAWRSRALGALNKALILEPDIKTLLWLRAELAGGRPQQPRGLTWAYLKALLSALAAALWIGFAAWHQDRSGGFAEAELLGLLVIGGGCVFLATVYRLFSLQALWSIVPVAKSGTRADARQSTALSDRDPVSDDDSEEQEGDFLDQHTLQH